MGRTAKAQAVVLRSIRFGEADRVLHLYTAERGRVNAIAKGVRRTTSRFGGRLEPLTHVSLLLHDGRGELSTVSGADIVRSHDAARSRPHALSVGLIGAEAVLKLHVEPDPQPRVFAGLVRFLDLLDGGAGTPAAPPTRDPLGLAFQLKLLLLAGYLPHLTSCAACGSSGPLTAYSASAGGAVCPDCRRAHGGFAVSAETIVTVEGLIDAPLEDAAVDPACAGEVLRVVEETYAHHGGFRLRTLRS
ncbi:MAG TPA: DNA repair protein RecO [Gaiellales bacterium]|nr:DNA repair protein RecO [Gaiellales bacterium]